MHAVDGLGFKLDLDHFPKRIVSLVPCWTETLFALGCGSEVVGVTHLCIAPTAAVAELPKVGGTKNPDLAAIAKLEPDFVLANAEENRREDIDELRAAGIPVFTTYPRTIGTAVDSILKLGRVLGHETEAGVLVRDIVRSVSEIETVLGVWTKLRFRVFCPVWKDPWTVFNADTYAHDVLRMLGFNNIFASTGERYPQTTLEAAVALRPDFVLLPDEPYAFGPKDVEALKPLLPPPLSRRVVLINGRDLHWYGVRMVNGLRSLATLLSRVRASAI
jgi:ABC-type Fe3+-hydroxamate transport system substrate-binding protein